MGSRGKGEWSGLILTVSVDFAAMADTNHQDGEYLILNLVDDAVVSHTDTVETAPACEGLGSGRARVFAQNVDPLLNSPLHELG